MNFYRDNFVITVLESSFTSCKLRFSARYFLVLPIKIRFSEALFTIPELRRHPIN